MWDRVIRKLLLFISYRFCVSIVCKGRRRAAEALTIISAAAADRASYTRLPDQLTPVCFHSDRVDAALPSSTPTPIFSMGLLLLLSTRIVLLSYWCALLKTSQWCAVVCGAIHVAARSWHFMYNCTLCRCSVLETPAIYRSLCEAISVLP